MSLENSLERIAIALEALVNNRAPSPAGAAGVDTEPAKAAPRRTKAAPPPPPAEATAVPTMELADLNAKLVEQFHRLGDNRGPIDQVLMSFGAQSIKDLKATDYAAVLSAVQAVPKPTA